MGRDGGDIEVIWVRREPKYFCKEGWTAKSPNSPSGKSVDLSTVARRVNPVGWVERSDTHRVIGILANGHRTCSKVMGFASAQPILRAIMVAGGRGRWRFGIMRNVTRNLTEQLRTKNLEKQKAAKGGKDR
jgi:hypothetical protein